MSRTKVGDPRGTVTDGIEPPNQQHALVRRFNLAVQQGPDSGTAIDSTGERTVIGTHESAQLRLTDRTVSRLHCELRIESGQVVLRDQESRNGTTVDGVPMAVAPLRSGAIIGIGRTRVRFQFAGDHVKVPLSEKHQFGSMIGSSTAMRAAFALLERAAASDSTVLLEGETGTGKEAATEGLHRESARRDGPLVVVDCSAIPPDLLESELFGHEKGAFTGAVVARAGAFEAAHGGTIFLDEIGELPMDLQPKLLRALESREVKRIGGNKFVPVDVRVVAATNRNLRGEVNAGRFRSDLYYRLAVVELRLPPLRERREDLPLIVDALLAMLGTAPEDAVALKSDHFDEDLQRHAWPGNVRELRNYIERCLTLRMRTPLTGSAPSEGHGAVDVNLPFAQARLAFERRYITYHLEREGGIVAAAARAAKIDRIHFYRLLWKHGLR